MNANISKAVTRVDAEAKSTGAAKYVSDLQFPGLLYARVLRSDRARATILEVHVPPLPEGYFFINKNDIPSGGTNEVLMIKKDWPVFADGRVRYIGEAIGLVVGPDRQRVLEILKGIEVVYEDLDPVFTLEEALALKGGPLYGDDNLYADYHLVKGDPDAAFDAADQIIEDEISTGYQEHIYMEPQGVIGTLEEGKITFYASSQCPFYIRKAVAHCLGLSPDEVRVKQAVTGGAFGGKEHFPDVMATPVAVAVHKIGKPVQLVLDRIEDISFTPKRHPSTTRFRTALDKDGKIIGMDIDVQINAGAYESCSLVVLQRAIFSSNSVYDIPNVKIRGRAIATNNVPSDAYRGFGAPQGLFAVEMHMSHLARQLGVDELAFKERYFTEKGGVTVTNGKIKEDVKLPEMLQKIKEASDYDRKAAEYSRGALRGIGISIFNHGSGFTGNGEQAIIKGLVTMRGRRDGKADLLVSNVEMGQGLQTTFRKIAAQVLGLPVEDVGYDNPDTDRVPDSGPTCASRSIAVVGFLVQECAKKLKAAWKPGEMVEVSHRYAPPPGLEWNQDDLQGDAYPSFGWGINVVEVEVDPVTYEVSTKGIWSVFDVGTAIDERVVEGQAHGGIIQGLGYASLEKLEAVNGRFRQHTMADYVIPTSMDFPSIHNQLVDNPYPYGPFGAKGAGELVFDGAAPAYADAVQWAIDKPVDRIPVTPEYLMEVIEG
ncbi:xanthine dehydrogenase family protein molybdopterin-binding subunit [Sediminispirochaeta smaragdinae]|jgi:CO/xanthine dehydrogenase Mo-binding subunit|uniref:Aldehyde oxidase and xanthine dehydrogenase molybdopterin binding protein n=1 Tax=Sediminispirochaeta smaragdinae (strain DSM 11293 / JCM 15392 / SEBR 4228) TaxID=573413 RepID=E1R494_SEDSS|nr:xanthine dehydrogenase family protein molybdopterin-binding subunit [Sediminispirochaeta smaragdinae]ADK80516.1 aldehyde oxidase and xanthine dehydrogenase molybdopterin binding protein [Sediminispirochaeta smaragdinae DSM 11293]